MRPVFTFKISPTKKVKIEKAIEEFCCTFKPIEQELFIFEDALTDAVFCECHIAAQRIISLGTVDSPLDPEGQAEYRANRKIDEDSMAFIQMKIDAKNKRSFSNIVAEYNTDFDKERPLKIVGGQHRYTAIKEALEAGVDQIHGVKVYFSLDMEQRLDAQLISNTNIAVSPDLLDRMLETVNGPELRNWCQKVGLLPENTDFADRKQRNGELTVRAARTFIINYYNGKAVLAEEFGKVKTIPYLAKTGGIDEVWEKLRLSCPELWKDQGLCEAGTQFAKLVQKQRSYFTENGKVFNSDYADKATGYAILAAWAYIAGVLNENKIRLERHYCLSNIEKTDPLNTKVLAKVKHKTDPENYRGLGTRTDAKERGRLTELFFLQAEKGSGITKESAEAAIARYYAKQAALEAQEAENKVQSLC